MKDITSTKGHCVEKSKEMQPVAEYMYNNAEVAVKAPATNPSDPAILFEVENGHFLVPNFLIYVYSEEQLIDVRPELFYLFFEPANNVCHSIPYIMYSDFNCYFYH